MMAVRRGGCISSLKAMVKLNSEQASVIAGIHRLKELSGFAIPPPI